MNKARKFAAIGAALVCAGGITAAASSANGSPPSVATTALDPGDFTHPRQNPYFPLLPGAVIPLPRAPKSGVQYIERVLVTQQTKRIQGVATTVVRDILRRADGTLAEKTRDWYAADNAGNVWYFGEATATYNKHGHIQSREGSWQAGVGGAVAGQIMPADPRPDQRLPPGILPGPRRGPGMDRATPRHHHRAVRHAAPRRAQLRVDAAGEAASSR